MRSLPTILLPLAMLSACGGTATTTADNAATANAAQAAPDGGYAARVTALTPRLRQGVFLRAIRDAGEQCQEVTDESAIAPIDGKPAWAATCDKSTQWVISIDRTGTALVTKVSPASPTGQKG